MNPFISIHFSAQTDNNEHSVTGRLDFERSNIRSSEAKSSTLAKLQHCLYNKSNDEFLANALTCSAITQKINELEKLQTPSGKGGRTPYIIAGIGAGLLILLIAYKLNLLPTELPASFKNILSNNQLGQYIVP